MLKIGITGGIGSGKSTIAKMFETLGIPVYYADKEAKRLMNEDAGLKDRIINEFGQEAYTAVGLDRSFIAKQVFGNPEKLERLNQLVHPVTITDAHLWMEKQDAPYVLKEAAIIFESGSATGLDLVIGVFAPKHLRIKRVMDRDGVSRDDVLRRMANQIDESLKMKLCDHVILNDEQHPVIPQVLSLHKLFSEKLIAV